LPEDEAIAGAMHAYWVSFAKTGSPASAGGPAWPAVKPREDPVMEFGADGPAVRTDFKKLELDIFAARAEQTGGDAPRP
jgi:para-nitrobenzyl esterase